MFKNYLIAKEKFKPDYFLYENNKSAAQPIKNQISHELGVDLQYINSALVSAQNRQRFYAHNIPNVEQPEDRGILLKDILESGLTYQKKAFCLTANYTGAYPADLFKSVRSQVLEIDKDGYEVKDQKIHITGYNRKRNSDYVNVPNIPDGKYRLRPFTVAEASRLQTMPDDYTNGIARNQAIKCLGNGWTAEVIIHILKHMNIPLDEPIEVLSMYDGIGTGRYCFDKLGYKNITYFATEIDKYAIKVSNSNYPDIIQCGDAFQVRDEMWDINKLIRMSA